ncbi:MAG: glycosyltransferase family 2 protein [Bacteroidales bacterium]|nr:glycosyltransferase family 2 protein [Bacteroidales bacterium]
MISIIIVNYNTALFVNKAIESILLHTKDISYEIIIVDNNSSQDLQSHISVFKEKVSVIYLAENIGFGRANNEGLKIATGRYVFFLNPDTILLNNAINILADFLDQHPHVGVCGGNLYDADGMPNHSYMPSLPSPIWELNSLFGNILFKLRYGKNIQFNFTANPLPVGYITGADMMVRGSVLEQCGAFDPDFFMYYEETELTYRIIKAGFSIMSVPNAKIIHLEGQSFATNDNRENLKSISRKLYYKKTQPAIALLLSNILLRLNCLLRIVLFSILLESNKQKYWKLIYKNI